MPVPLVVPGPGPEAVAKAIARVLTLPVNEKEALRIALRELVVREHNLDVLLDRIIEHLRELVGRKQSTAGSFGATAG